MASSFSSNPASKSPKKYDVFISFRGEDTRFNFMSHLHYALRSKQIDTYIDYRLEKGEEVWPSLEKAIEHSTLFIVIFSENYASSTWCLRELTKILECSKNEAHLVVPVFYRVDPSHVRKQSGIYQKAFKKHDNNKSINKQQLLKWREALIYAASLSGWHCNFNRNEAEQIIEIVRCVIQKLGCKYSENDLKELIGIHKRMEDVESLLDTGSNNVQFIGIWGIGGIGKTTLAKALFNKLHFSYEGFCFLDNVREESKKYGIAALRKKLILMLLGDKESHIGMLDEISPYYAMSRLGRKKSFIVLDDVDDHEQLDNLARRHDWFGLGSKILITTRDKQILGKKVDYIYTLEALNVDEAFQLFSLNAFKKDCGVPKIRELANKVTDYAYGNPLALKVLGSFLYGKNQEAWESLLEKLEKLPCPKIYDILRLSFEGLDCEEKNIFLDIACFLNGYYVEDVINLLDACGYSAIIGLERLKDKALLCTYDFEKRISMHPLIKEMGRQIVREESYDPKRRSRLWNSKEIFEILKKNTGSEAIEGITLNLSEVEAMCLSPQVFCSMPNLKFLNFHKIWNDEDGKKLRFPCGIDFLPSKLRLLHWTEYPLESLPAQVKVEHLVQIVMPHSNLTQLWDGVQNLVNLCKIELPGSIYLIELPNLSKATHLATVNLNHCSKLRSVHPSILSHHSLRCLWLRDCRALTSLTSHTHLKSLADLDLTDCSRLNKFSVTSENCRFQLQLSGTAIDEKLLSSSGNLSKIDSLFLNKCTSVTNLPYKLADLSNIRRLYICGCNKLASNLCLIFDRLRTLEVLWMADCSELLEVPDSVSLLSSLRALALPGTNIETLPQSIKYLSCLEHLYLDGCGRLRFLPELPPSVLTLSTVNCLSFEFLHLSLMSADGEGKVSYYDHYDEVEPYPYFIFINCIKLGRQSIKVAEAKVLLEVNKATCDMAKMKYPGERVPEWFMHRTSQSFLTVDLNSIPQHWDCGFIFCVVISKSPKRTYIDATWCIDGEYAFNAERYFYLHEMTLSDHVILWYDPYSFQQLQRKIEEKKTNAQNNNYHPLLGLEF